MSLSWLICHVCCTSTWASVAWAFTSHWQVIDCQEKNVFPNHLASAGGLLCHQVKSIAKGCQTTKIFAIALIASRLAWLSIVYMEDVCKYLLTISWAAVNLEKVWQWKLKLITFKVKVFLLLHPTHLKKNITIILKANILYIQLLLNFRLSGLCNHEPSLLFYVTHYLLHIWIFISEPGESQHFQPSFFNNKKEIQQQLWKKQTKKTTL